MSIAVTSYSPVPRVTRGWFSGALARAGALVACLLAHALPAQVPTGAVHGVVTNEATGNYVESAVVDAVALGRSTLTDSAGRFRIGGLPAGDHEIRVTSAGLTPGTVRVTVVPGESTALPVALGSEAIMMESVMVSTQAEGQVQALNLQRESESIRKVVSSDALAIARAGEVGEALQSLSGVYLEISTHQPVRPVVRGVSSEFNSLTFDGVRAGNTNADRRDGVSGFPAEALQRVELYKSVTPDMNGDAIGGAINLVSRRAFDLAAPLQRLTLGATYNDQLQNFDKEGSFDFGRTFLDGRMGVLLSLNHYRSDRGYQEVTSSYSVDSSDRFTINNLTVLDRIEDDSWKAKASGSVEFKVGAGSVLTLSGMYSNNSRYLEDRRYVISGGSRTFVTPDSGTASGARYTIDRRYREPVSIGSQFAAGMQHNLDLWTVDYRAAYTHSSNRYHESFYPDVRTAATTFSYDRADRWFPTFTPTGTVDINNPASYSHNGYNRTQGPTKENLTTLLFNARRELTGFARKAYFKVGAAATLRAWHEGADGLGNWTYTGPQPASAFIESHTNDNLLREAGGRLLIPGISIALDPVFDAFYNHPEYFTRQDFASDLAIAQRVSAIDEHIYAGYALGSIQLGRLGVLAGARVEHTSFDGVANRVTQSGGAITGITPTPVELTDTQVLPGLHLNYAAGSQWIVRGAVYQTLARPGGGDLLPSATVNETSRSVSEGNPDLEVTESVNFDLSLEYYLKPIGVVSAGLFSKDIDGFYFSRTSTIEGGEYDGYSLNRVEMGTGGKVRGLELEWQQRLGFLPGLLGSLTLGANYTWIESEGRYPNRPGDSDLTFIGTAPRNGNVSLSYARRGLDVRVFYNWRDDLLNGVGGRPALDVYEQSRDTVDVYFRYRPEGGRFVYTLNGKNLSNSPRVTYQGDAGNPRSVRFFDWSLSASVGLNF